jgi:hypothetical protein
MPKFKNPTTGVVVEQENRSQQDLANQGFSPIKDESSNVITPDSLKNEPKIELPNPAEDTNNYYGIINEGKTYASSVGKTMADVNAPPTEGTSDILANYLKGSEAPKSQADEYAGLYGTTPEKLQTDITTSETDVAEKSKVYKQAQDEFNLLNAKMEALNLEAKAVPEKIQQESIGRGRTVGGVAPLTSAKLRDIALRSLPLQGQMYSAQAKVANAQGNVELSQKLLDKAQGKLDKVFELKMNDITNKYNYQKELRDKVYDFATAEEQRKLDTQKEKNNQDFTLLRDNMSFAKELSKIAMGNGQADISADIASLDPKSATYRDDLNKLQAKISVPPKDKGTQLVEVGGRKILINSQTGETIKDLGISASKITFQKIGVDDEGNDIMGFVDAENQKVNPMGNVSTNENATYTDGPGNVNNVAGWAANDTSKVSAMQSVADRIGKLTDENIDEKVKQFTPGVTTDIIKNASAISGVSWEAIMAQIVQESVGGTSNVAKNNNNFAGITFNNQEWIKEFGGTQGTARPAAEGGNYVKFPTKQDGVNALAALQASYNSRIKADGGDKFDKFSQEQIALSVMPVQTRNSEVELKRALAGIQAGLKKGLTPYEIADSLMGYKINNPDSFSTNMRGYISQSPNIVGTDPSEFARLINSGNKAGAVKKIETSITKGTDTQQVETAARYAYDLAPKIYKEISAMSNKFGLVAGNWSKLEKKVSASPEFQKISSELVAFAQEWRKQMSGTAVTETELKMIDELLPSVTDNPINLQAKIKSFAEYQLNLVNARRGTLNLPRLNNITLLDYNSRVSLYENNDDPLGIK